MKSKTHVKTKKIIGIITLASCASAFPLFSQFTNTNKALARLAAASSSETNEFLVEGFEHQRVINLFSNPSDFKSAFTPYDGSKFNLGYVVGSSQFNSENMGANDWVTPGQCNAWISVGPKDTVYFNNKTGSNGHYATTINVGDIDSPTQPDYKEIQGHGFEYFKTDIETGKTRNIWGVSRLADVPGTTHNTKYFQSIEDLNNPGTNLFDFSTPQVYEEKIADLSDFEPFTVKFGVAQNISNLSFVNADIWFTYPRWNDIGEAPSDNPGNYGFGKVEGNTTYWKALSGGKYKPIKREGLIFTLSKDPNNKKIGIYSGSTTIEKPTINPACTGKIIGMLPSEAVDLMFSSQLPLFTQESTQSFPGAIYGDSTYKIITDDNLGKITIKYKPGSLLKNGEVVDYDGEEFSWDFFGFGITDMKPMLDPRKFSIDVGYNYDVNNHIIDMFQKPSEVPQSDIEKFVFNHIKSNVINPPSNFKASDIEVSFVPYDSQKRILIDSITIKRIRISTPSGAIADTNYPQTYKTDFFLYGFKNKPIAPPFVTLDDFKTQVWLDASSFNLIPQVLYQQLKTGNNQKLNDTVIAATKDSLSFNPDYLWDDANSTFKIGDLQVLSNAVDGNSKGFPQIQATINLYNLRNKRGETSSYSMTLYVYNCPKVLPNNLNMNIPKTVNAVDVNAAMSYMSKQDFMNNGVYFLTDYLSDQYNVRRANTSIPYATISNINLSDVEGDENALIATYDVTNVLKPNDHNSNPDFLLSDQKNVSIQINNFYTPPSIAGTINNTTTTFIAPSNLVPINAFSVMSSKFASDFIADPAGASRTITDLVLKGNAFEAMFKNLPPDYKTAARYPVILNNSFVADDLNGTLTFSFALTYAMINGEKVSVASGTSIINTIVLTGFKTTKNIPSINNETINISTQSGDANYNLEFKNWFKIWVKNNLITPNNLANTSKKIINNFMTTDYTVSLSGISFDVATNTATFFVKIPELTLLVPSLGTSFSDGFNINFTSKGSYLSNSVTVLNDGHINKTYDSFKDALSSGSIIYTDLITVKNALPDGAKVSIKLNPYDEKTNSAIVEFKFSKYYSSVGMVENYVESYNFSFIPKADSGSSNKFVDTLTLPQLNTAVPINPIAPLTAAQIVYEFNNSPVYQEQIKSLVNDPMFIQAVLPDDDSKDTTLVCQNIILDSPTSVEMIFTFKNGMNESLLLTGLNQAVASSVNLVPVLSPDITFSNISNIFRGLNETEINQKASEFITASSLPEGTQITAAEVFNVGIDSSGQKTAFINFTFDKFFVSNNAGVVIYPNYIVQVKLNFNDSARIHSEITGMGVKSNQPIKEISNNNQTLIIVLSSLGFLALVGLATALLIYKKKGGK